MDDSRSQYRSSEQSSCKGLLGAVPHTIRGSLWNHEMRLTITHRFPSCTACSIPLINEYRNRGFDFVLDACNQPNYLERIAGLEDLFKRPDLDEVCFIQFSLNSYYFSNESDLNNILFIYFSYVMLLIVQVMKKTTMLVLQNCE